MRIDNSSHSISRPGALVLTLALFAGSLLLYSRGADTAATPAPEPAAPMTAFTGGTFEASGRDFTFIVFDTSGYAATD